MREVNCRIFQSTILGPFLIDKCLCVQVIRSMDDLINLFIADIMRLFSTLLPDTKFSLFQCRLAFWLPTHKENVQRITEVPLSSQNKKCLCLDSSQDLQLNRDDMVIGGRIDSCLILCVNS